MLPEQVLNPGPLTYELDALLIALRGPAQIFYFNLYLFNLIQLISQSIFSGSRKFTLRYWYFGMNLDIQIPSQIQQMAIELHKHNQVPVECVMLYKFSCFVNKLLMGERPGIFQLAHVVEMMYS